jgi:hypothetical protein
MRHTGFLITETLGLLALSLATTASFADPCNGKVAKPPERCGNDTYCSGVAGDCQLAGTINPLNCQSVARFANTQSWECVSGGSANTLCTETGGPFPCENWSACFYSMDNFDCRTGSLNCYNYPQAYNPVAVNHGSCSN